MSGSITRSLAQKFMPDEEALFLRLSQFREHPYRSDIALASALNVTRPETSNLEEQSPTALLRYALGSLTEEPSVLGRAWIHSRRPVWGLEMLTERAIAPFNGLSGSFIVIERNTYGHYPPNHWKILGPVNHLHLKAFLKANPGAAFDIDLEGILQPTEHFLECREAILESQSHDNKLDDEWSEIAQYHNSTSAHFNDFDRFYNLVCERAGGEEQLEKIFKAASAFVASKRPQLIDGEALGFNWDLSSLDGILQRATMARGTFAESFRSTFQRNEESRIFQILEGINQISPGTWSLSVGGGVKNACAGRGFRIELTEQGGEFTATSVNGTWIS